VRSALTICGNFPTGSVYHALGFFQLPCWRALEEADHIGVTEKAMRKKFKWPEHILFDDTEADIKAARKVWLGFFGCAESGGTKGEFLAFVQAYSEEVDKRWEKQHHQETTSASA
jgi:hypothetical protein